MPAIACPACGATLNYQSPVTVFLSCGYCKSSLLRKDVDWTRYGEVGELMPEETVLQLGTQIEWHKRSYTLMGRIQRKWSRGTWSEWYMAGGDVPHWLSFAQGEYAVTKQTSEPVKGADWNNLKVGNPVEVRTFGIYDVTDRKEVEILAIEGELPFVAKVKTASKTIDARSKNGSFLTLEWEDNELLTFVGQATTFKELNARNLRQLDDWR